MLSGYALDLQLTIEHIAEAMESGRSVQFLPGFEACHYDGIGSGSRRLLWQRIDDSIFGQATDLAEYERLQEQLADQRTLAALAVRARTLAEDRERIARNLHDSVIQRLYAAALELEFLSMDGTPPPERSRLGTIGRDLQGLIAEIRNEIFDVKRSIETGLREELLDVMMPMAQAYGVSVEVETDVRGLDDADLAQNVRAVVRESASNAIRHGHASRVSVSVGAGSGQLAVTITDNGVGINGDPGESSGLANLRRRAELMGGGLDLSNVPGRGVQVCWRVPLRDGPRPVHHSGGGGSGMSPTISVAVADVGTTTGERRVSRPEAAGGGGVSDPRIAVRRP